MKKITCLRVLFMLAISAFVLTGCSSDGSESEKSESEEEGKLLPDSVVMDMLPETRAIDLSSEQRAYVDSNNEFSFTLYKTVNALAEEKKSDIVSPISVTYLLGMLNDGAVGQAAKEITDVLGFGVGSAADVNTYCQKLMTEAPLVDPNVSLATANYIALNSRRNVSLKGQFATDMKDFYQAEVNVLDFTSASALQKINDWCSNKTDGMIPSIIDNLDGSSLMALMNAVNFKATWTEKFDKTATKTETFTTEDGTKQDMKMMNSEKAVARYAANDQYATLQLPFGSGDKWSMFVLLPQEGTSVDELIDSLNVASWKENLHAMKEALLNIKLPRFNVQTENDLSGAISQMGASSMFIGGLDNICTYDHGAESAYVSIIKQKAATEVDEDGARMVAVSVALVCGANIPSDIPSVVDFHANRPFVYIIQEASSGAIFFIGTYRGE